MPRMKLLTAVLHCCFFSHFAFLSFCSPSSVPEVLTRTLQIQPCSAEAELSPAAAAAAAGWLAVTHFYNNSLKANVSQLCGHQQHSPNSCSKST